MAGNTCKGGDRRLQETEEIKSKGNEHVLFVFGFIFGRGGKGGGRHCGVIFWWGIAW